MKTIAATTALIAAVPLVLLGAGPAHAGHDREVVRHGSCSGSTDWKMKAKADDGRLEVEAEIDSNRSGQTWHWVLRHEGNLVDRGRSTTAGRSGSFDVERKTRNSAGADTFRFRAVNRASGETCVARVSY